MVFESLPMDLNTFCIEGADPIISVLVIFLGFSISVFSNALLTIDDASSKSNGLGRYSNAPPPYASTAACISVNAVMIMTGTSS